MRRKPITYREKPKYHVGTEQPLFFWKKCEVCGYEFRRETLTVISIHWTMKRMENHCNIECAGGETDYFYYCSRCCSPKEAEEHFKTNHLPKYVL